MVEAAQQRSGNGGQCCDGVSSAKRETAVAGTKTTAETAMAGDTVNNQLKGVAEETTAVGMVTAAETATAMKMVTIEAAGWVIGKTEPKKYC